MPKKLNKSKIFDKIILYTRNLLEIAKTKSKGSRNTFKRSDSKEFVDAVIENLDKRIEERKEINLGKKGKKIEKKVFKEEIKKKVKNLKNKAPVFRKRVEKNKIEEKKRV